LVVVAINRVFIGLLLTFIDINLDGDGTRIGLIPDFVGYAFVLKGLYELAEQSDWFERVRPHVMLMIVYSVIFYALDLLGVTVSIWWLYVVLMFFSMILSLYITYCIIMGVKDIEQSRGQELNSSQLYSTWKAMAVLLGVAYVLLFLPVLALISAIGSLVAAIAFMVALYKTKQLYSEHDPAS
jgi:hypothetical protein